MVTLDVAAMDFREVNRRLRELVSTEEQVVIQNPHGLHNFAIGLQGRLDIIVKGNLGVYVGGFMEGPSITVCGDTGWYAADNMIAGRLVVEGSTGSNPAPSMIGGTVVIKGHGGSRVGYGLKGGDLVVFGNVGLETGKMMMGGRIVVLGDAGAKVGESMYGGVIHVLGRVDSAGDNVVVGSPQGAEAQGLSALLNALDLRVVPSAFSTFLPRPGKHVYTLFRPGRRGETPADAGADRRRGGHDHM